MLRWFRRLLTRPSDEDRWGTMCGVLLQHEQFSNLRNLNDIYTAFMDGLGDAVAYIAEHQDVSIRTRRAREKLLDATKAFAIFKRFTFLSQNERRKLHEEYWPGRELTDEEAIHAANTNYYVQLARISCLSLILDDIVKPNEEDWWTDFSILILADPDAKPVNLAEISILNGTGLAAFSEQLATASSTLKRLSQS